MCCSDLASFSVYCLWGSYMAFYVLLVDIFYYCVALLWTFGLCLVLVLEDVLTLMSKAAMNILIHVFLNICTQFSLPTSLNIHILPLVEFLAVGIICWHSILEDDFSVTPSSQSNITGIRSTSAFTLSCYINVTQSWAMTAFFSCPVFLLYQLTVLEFMNKEHGRDTTRWQWEEGTSFPGSGPFY